MWLWRGSWRWICWRRIRDGNHGALRFSRIATQGNGAYRGPCVALDRDCVAGSATQGSVTIFGEAQVVAVERRGFCRCFSSASSSQKRTGVWGNLEFLRCVCVTNLTPLSLKSWTWKPWLLARALKDFRQAAGQIASCRKSTFTPSSVCTSFEMFLLCFE